MDKDMFRSKMALHRDTYRSIAEFLDISEPSVTNKVNGKNDWTQSQIAALVKRYGLTPEETNLIFFNLNRLS